MGRVATGPARYPHPSPGWTGDVFDVPRTSHAPTVTPVATLLLLSNSVAMRGEPNVDRNRKGVASSRPNAAAICPDRRYRVERGTPSSRRASIRAESRPQSNRSVRLIARSGWRDRPRRAGRSYSLRI